MNYYYDIVLNLREDNLMYYEWNKNDCLEEYKKIPFFHVTSKTLLDLVNNNIEVKNDFLELIKKEKSEYIALFADKNSVIALEFNNDGKSIYRSFIPYDDELNILETLYTSNIYNLKYKKLNSISYNRNIREYDNIKRLIQREIVSLINNNDYSKLKYLYMEWFNNKNNNIKYIIDTMNKKLKNDIGDKELKIYEIIKLSYSN